MLTPIEIQNHSLKTAVRGYSKQETDDFLEEILEGYESLYKENRELKDKVSSLSEGVQYYKQMETTLQKALVLAEKTSAETQEAAQAKADAVTNEAQAKAEAMINEAQAKAEAMINEAQSKADSILTETQTKADSILSETQTRADSIQAKADSTLTEAQMEADGIRKEIQAYSDIKKSKANRELEETRNHVRKLVQSYETYRLQFKKLAESQIEMLESENFSIFVPELKELLDDAPNADTAMETQKTVAINLKSSDEIAAEASSKTKQSPLETVFIKKPDEKPPVLAETAATQENTIEHIEIEKQTAQPVDTASNPIREIDANAINPDNKSVEEAGQEINVDDIVPNSESAEDAGQEINADDIVPGSGSAKDVRQEISADDIVPGSGSAGSTEQEIGTIPKLEGFEEVTTKTVMPNNDSPFTFIETE